MSLPKDILNRYTNTATIEWDSKDGKSCRFDTTMILGDYIVIDIPSAFHVFNPDSDGLNAEEFIRLELIARVLLNKELASYHFSS